MTTPTDEKPLMQRKGWRNYLIEREESRAQWIHGIFWGGSVVAIFFVCALAYGWFKLSAIPDWVFFLISVLAGTWVTTAFFTRWKPFSVKAIFKSIVDSLVMLGFRDPRPMGMDILLAMALGFGAVFAVLILALATNAKIVTGTGWAFAERNDTEIGSMILAALISQLPTALWEEIVFRGFILQAVQKCSNFAFGVIVASVIFALGHSEFADEFATSNVFAFALAFLGGWAFACAFRVRKALWLSVSFHYMWNFTEALLKGDGSQPGKLSLIITTTSSGGNPILLLINIGVLLALVLIFFCWGNRQRSHENTALPNQNGGSIIRA
jgi:membrane protease YdiL (CAAX protease family)